MNARFSSIACACLFFAACGCSRQVNVLLKFQPKDGETFAFKSFSKVAQSLGANREAYTETSDLVVMVNARTGALADVVQRTNDYQVQAPAGSRIAKEASALQGLYNGLEVEFHLDVQAHAQDFEVKSDNPAARALSAANEMMNAGFMGITFPATPVHVGSTWQETLDYGPTFQLFYGRRMRAPGNLKVPVVFRVEKIDNVAGKTVVTVSSRAIQDLKVLMSLTPKSDKYAPVDFVQDFRATYVIDATNGVLLSSVTDSKRTADASPPFTQTNHTEITRI